MYDLATIHAHAHVYSFLVQEYPEMFDGIVKLPKTKGLISKICKNKKWMDGDLSVKELKSFIIHWKTDQEYSVTLAYAATLTATDGA